MTLEHQLGIKLSAFIAGLAGGLVSLTYEHSISPWRAIVMILAGGVTAGYAFTAMETYWGLQHNYSGILGFALGLTAMRLIDILIKLAEQAKKDPSILLSIPRLFKVITNGATINDPSGTTDSGKPGVNSPGTNSKEDNAKM